MSENDKPAENSEVPAWKILDEAVRSWIVKRQFDEDLENYQNLQEQYR